MLFTLLVSLLLLLLHFIGLCCSSYTTVSSGYYISRSIIFIRFLFRTASLFYCWPCNWSQKSQVYHWILYYFWEILLFLGRARNILLFFFFHKSWVSCYGGYHQWDSLVKLVTCLCGCFLFLISLRCIVTIRVLFKFITTSSSRKDQTYWD